MHDDDLELDEPTVVLTDESGRSLTCYVEKTMELEGENFVLLLPVDSPVEVFSWQSTEDEDEEVLVDVEDTDIDPLFDTARAVLAEHDLVLKRTALTLTVAGELPEVDENELITLDIEEDETEAAEEGQSEQFQILATFFHNDQEYLVCTPLDPLLFFARMKTSDEPELLSPEEFNMLRSQLEDQLFDELEE